MTKPREYSSGYWPEKIREYAAGLCSARQGRLLEFGCGEGLFLKKAKKINPSLEVWGIDRREEILKRAEVLLATEGMKGIRLIPVHGSRLPFDDMFFDTIVCINVFLNMRGLAEVEEAVCEMVRVLRPGGSLIAEFRNGLNPFVLLKYRLARYYDRTIREQDLPLVAFKRREMEGLFLRCGCSIKKTMFFGFPYNGFSPIIIFEARKE